MDGTLVVPYFHIRPILSQDSMVKDIRFDDISDDEFEKVFFNIISRSSKDNTYKFAFARFLLDYSREHTKTHVSFDTIAGYFLEYYWTQICKKKMKHAPQAAKKPMIVKIIEKEFDKAYYPHTFRQIRQKEPEKIRKCVMQIKKHCFHNVTWRFQRIKVNMAIEARLFFEYKIDRTVHSNKKYVDLEHGINLNPRAREFFKRYNQWLLKSVILEWARFLEKLNVGLPKIIAKTEGRNTKRGSLTTYRKMLFPLFKECFYCGEQLYDKPTPEVEHVIPFDYIEEDDIWNLTLACKECNCRKLGALPPRKYIDKLIDRNKSYRTEIPKLEKSLTRLDQKFEKIINRHYENAKSHGYMVIRNFQCM